MKTSVLSIMLVFMMCPWMAATGGNESSDFMDAFSESDLALAEAPAASALARLEYALASNLEIELHLELKQLAQESSREELLSLFQELSKKIREAGREVHPLALSKMVWSYARLASYAHQRLDFGLVSGSIKGVVKDLLALIYGDPTSFFSDERKASVEKKSKLLVKFYAASALAELGRVAPSAFGPSEIELIENTIANLREMEVGQKTLRDSVVAMLSALRPLRMNRQEAKTYFAELLQAPARIQAQGLKAMSYAMGIELRIATCFGQDFMPTLILHERTRSRDWNDVMKHLGRNHDAPLVVGASEVFDTTSPGSVRGGLDYLTRSQMEKNLMDHVGWQHADRDMRTQLSEYLRFGRPDVPLDLRRRMQESASLRR